VLVRMGVHLVDDDLQLGDRLLNIYHER
jgi:hypothetical protein